MPSISDYEEISLAGLEIAPVSWQGDRLRFRAGGGRGSSAVVGPSYGLWGWELYADVLADDAAYNDDINSMPSYQYYQDFIQRHTTGEKEIFIIDFRGRKFFASFADNGHSGELLTYDLLSMGGVRVEMRTVDGIPLHTDGSIFYPSDVSGIKWWYEITSTTSIPNIQDLSSNNRDLACEAPMPDLTTNGGVDVIRWNGSNDNPLINTDGSVTVTHVFVVCCATDATHDASPASRGLISGKTLGVLAAEASTTKFVDFGYTTNFEYKKNGTAFADNNAQCPMSGALAVVEAKFPSTVGIDDYLQFGLDRQLSGRIWEGDMAASVGFNNASMTANEEYKLRKYLANEFGGITVV